MHVRPIVIVAILAAAAGAATARYASGGGSPAFAVVAPSSEHATRGDVRAPAFRASDSVRDPNGEAPAAFDASADGKSASARSGGRALVYVAGNVHRPGVYALGENARVADALRAAGGPTSDADPIAVDLAARIEDGEEIAVPARGMADAASVPEPGDAVSAPRQPHARHRRRRKHAHRKPRADAVDDARASETVDVNAADAATLATLPGIGLGLAERIVAFRDLNGPFASTDELLDVGGVTASKVERLASSVTFDIPSAKAPVAR